MEQKFYFTVQEAKKVNNLLPKGFQVITQDQFKRRLAKFKKIGQPPPLQERLKSPVPRQIEKPYYAAHHQVGVTPVQVQKALSKQPKAEKYVPVQVEHPIVQPQPQFEDIKGPLTAKVILERLNQHPAINTISSCEMKQFQSNYRDITQKVMLLGEQYTVDKIKNNVSRICLRIYQTNPKDSKPYQEAQNIETYLSKLIRVDKEAKAKEAILAKPQAFLNDRQPYAGPPQALPQPKKKMLAKPQEVINTNSITLAEKRELGQKIKRLCYEDLHDLCILVFDNAENKEYTLDLDALHFKKFRELQQFVQKCLPRIEDGNGVLEKEDDDQISNESMFIIDSEGESPDGTTAPQVTKD